MRPRRPRFIALATAALLPAVLAVPAIGRALAADPLADVPVTVVAAAQQAQPSGNSSAVLPLGQVVVANSDSDGKKKAGCGLLACPTRIASADAAPAPAHGANPLLAPKGGLVAKVN